MVFKLRRTPTIVKRASRGRSVDETPVFEPFEESLPLQSGYYSFVIDAEGNFRVKRGNTQSHSAMVPGGCAAAAGRFYVDRLGQVLEVVVQSHDFAFYFSDPSASGVQYVVDSFRDHEALNLHFKAVFTFFSARFVPSWSISAEGEFVADPQAWLSRLAEAHAGDAITASISEDRLVAFATYTPTPPPRLYSMQQDQLIAGLEADAETFEYGPAQPRLAPSSLPLRIGKSNFVIDAEGWLILGFMGHQLLSGGSDVGGAGHIELGAEGAVSRIELNFSGHYRPDLTADYCRYVYRTIAGHPLLRLAVDCTYAGRLFRDCEAVSRVIEFSKEELESDDPKLDWQIESLTF